MVEPIISKKRFIAGAVCAQCQALDRVVVEFVAATRTDPELSRRRCVSCGFSDNFSSAGQRGSQGVPQSVPKGRPERGIRGTIEPSTVRIVGADVNPVD